jgi:hypothetical protein
MLEGHVSHEGSPQPGAQVLLADPARQRLLARASSGADGRFALEVDEPPASAVVLARCTQDAIGLAVADVEPGAELELALEERGPLWPLTVHVSGDELPDELELTLLPLALDGLTEETLWLLWLPVDDVVHGGFAARPLPRGGLTLPVQAGSWLVSAQRLVAFAARAPGLEPPSSWVTLGAEVDDRPLERQPEGFLVDLHGPTTVTLDIGREPRP